MCIIHLMHLWHKKQQINNLTELDYVKTIMQNYQEVYARITKMFSITDSESLKLKSSQANNTDNTGVASIQLPMKNIYNGITEIKRIKFSNWVS